jgi:hypothetical protein
MRSCKSYSLFWGISIFTGSMIVVSDQPIFKLGWRLRNESAGEDHQCNPELTLGGLGRFLTLPLKGPLPPNHIPF